MDRMGGWMEAQTNRRMDFQSEWINGWIEWMEYWMGLKNQWQNDRQKNGWTEGLVG